MLAAFLIIIISTIVFYGFTRTMSIKVRIHFQHFVSENRAMVCHLKFYIHVYYVWFSQHAAVERVILLKKFKRHAAGHAV